MALGTYEYWHRNMVNAFGDGHQKCNISINPGTKTVTLRSAEILSQLVLRIG